MSSSRDALRQAGVGAAVFLAMAAILYAAVMAATGGVFSFTLDDPYIHLAMAEEIGRGGYGVNPGEPASASSSVLYPFLLAALLKLGLGQFAALWVNLACGAISTALLLELSRAGGLIEARTPVWAVALLAGLLALILNLVGLAFTGMEHSAQVALALAALLGVRRAAERGRGPVWLVPVLVAAPLVRFEGMAVLGAGCVALIAAGRWRPAVAAAALTALVLGLFAWRLHALGLPLLPSSVLAKAGDGARGLGAQFAENQHVRESVLVLLAIALPVATDVMSSDERRSRTPALFGALALAAQLAVGTFGWRYNGWLHRYEAWAMATAAGLLMLCYGSRVRGWLAPAPDVRGIFAGLTAMLLLQPYVLTTLGAPQDARSIRLQQREMHRFAADVLRAPVAVNDLGWVSFRNDGRVLDLWGLASEPARIARQAHAPPGWMDALVRREGVRAIMVYDGWIGPHPARWVRLGDLRARVPMTVGPDVAFYAAGPEEAPEVRDALRRWTAGLPRQDVFVWAPASRMTAN